MALTFLVLGVSILIAGLIVVYLKNKQLSDHIQQSLVQTDSQLKRSNALENELQQEIGSLQNRVNELMKDSVTGLPVWPLFADRVTQIIHECERYNLVMGVLFVDIGDFNMVNSALGHELGNLFLCEVAKRLQTCIRQVDMLSRQTKDVFVIMLARLAKPETAVVVAQRILYELSQPFLIGDREIVVTANIGLAMYPTDGNEAESLLRCAEQALHLSKMKGKQGFQFYHDELQTQALRELAIYSCMAHDNFYNELKLYFQPIVNIKEESIQCIDTLLEWQHPEVGKLTTHEIYSYAEKQRKLVGISEWVIRTAARQFLAWREAGFRPKLLGIPLPIKVLENGQFVQHMAQILKELNFDPTMLLIEVPENFSRSSFQILEKSFNMLKYLKVNIGLDHFGAGSLALRYLKAFSFDYFKLERTLVDDVIENSRTQQLLKSTLTLANSLSIEIIVQGIETKEQEAMMRKLGYTLLQGIATGAPIAQDNVLERLS